MTKESDDDKLAKYSYVNSFADILDVSAENTCRSRRAYSFSGKINLSDKNTICTV